MAKKHLIEVRQYNRDQKFPWRDNPIHCTHGTIDRALRAEQIGNFNPIFCTYKGKRTLVHSDEGDLSDPYRRDESYAKSFFIKI